MRLARAPGRANAGPLYQLLRACEPYCDGPFPRREGRFAGGFRSLRFRSIASSDVPAALRMKAGRQRGVQGGLSPPQALRPCGICRAVTTDERISKLVAELDPCARRCMAGAGAREVER